jgi:hypothetical protein
MLMLFSRLRVVVCLLCAGALAWLPCDRVAAADVSARQVLEAIEKAKRMLLKSQLPDGAFNGGGSGDTHTVGVTSLALLALLNTGMSASDPEIQRGLGWLRRQQPQTTYEISLMIQALAAAKDGRRDLPIVAVLVKDLEEMQMRRGGANSGSWSYNKSMGNLGGGDRSNGQFAVLGLREAQEMGVPVSINTWRQARAHWLTSQNANGAWSYSGGGQPSGGSGSMTVAGIATLVITQAMLRAEERELNADGTPNCCGEPQVDKPLEEAYKWLGNNFAVTNNPGDGRWVLYYLYGLERAGRFSGRRFFVNQRGQKHDWYREGAEYLIATQQQFTGTWKEGDQNAIVGTSFALMFLSKGLAPVLINKLQYGQRDANRQTIGIDWNRHPDDIRNLTQFISNRPKWPKLLTWQTVDVAQANVADLMQAPIVFIGGSDAPQFTAQDVALFKEYILQGGFILVVNNCQSQAFDEGFRDLVRQMYPPSEGQLKKLGADHPVFRSEFLLIDEKTGEPSAELWGVDVGCRTSIMYSPYDLACLWDKHASYSVPGRPKELEAMISKSTRVGINIVAYVTGREILNKMQQQEQVVAAAEPEKVERDLLEIRKIRYTGDWDAAPQALRNLLVALNRTAGLAVATRPRDLPLLDKQLVRTPIVYMHGRHDFALGKAEQDKLREYIEQGGALFSDACCGVPAYDRSFRRLMEQIFPGNPLKRIPPDHELFTSKIGNDLKLVKRREPDVSGENAGLGVAVRNVEPFLEGIEINGRFVVIYSKYDISCALERQASVACTGYVHDDAVRLGVNVILYFMNQ